MVLAKAALGADAAEPATPSASSRADGLVMLDYPSIPIRGCPSIDLLGAHVFTQFNDWLHLGIGAHASLVKRRLRRLHRYLCGRGGSLRRLLRGPERVAGRFKQSVIEGTQADFFITVPFDYAIGSYADAGRHSSTRLFESPAVSDGNIVTFGVDNFLQIRLKGSFKCSFKGTASRPDLQFDQFLAKDVYMLVEGSVDVRGLPIYNQVLAGLSGPDVRDAVTRRLAVSAPLAVGTGGYAPARFDTDPGLLVYPKRSAGYRLTDNLGVALTGGYMFAPRAPRGTSRNGRLGAAFTYHLSPDRLHPRDGGAPGDTLLQGCRYSGFQQSELKAQVGHRNRFLIGHPLQASAQALAGINVHGVIVKPGVGLNCQLSWPPVRAGRQDVIGERGAPVPGTVSAQHDLRGLGSSHRFSLPL